MTVTVDMIPTWRVTQVWHILGPMVKKAADLCATEFDLDDTLDAILSEKARLMAVLVDDQPKAAIVASGMKTPKQHILLLELAGGDELHRWWEQAICDIIGKARVLGYDAIEIRGRKGWSRMAKKLNFREAHVTYKLEIQNG